MVYEQQGRLQQCGCQQPQALLRLVSGSEYDHACQHCREVDCSIHDYVSAMMSAMRVRLCDT